MITKDMVDESILIVSQNKSKTLQKTIAKTCTMLKNGIC
jgi:hypothetical protein